MIPPRFKQGLVVGKFSPLHLGHEFLIEQAAQACQHLLVLGYSQPEQAGCSRTRRQSWLDARAAQRHANVRALAFDDAWVAQRCQALGLACRPMPENDADDASHQHYLAWLITAVLRAELYASPEALFCSEPWGPACARVLSAALGQPMQAVLVDEARSAHPISASRIRAQPASHAQHLAPEVWADWLPRVVLLSGESSGKTTLAQALAQALHTEWVPEFGRQWWEQRGGQLGPDDLLQIAQEQCRLEDEAALRVARAGGRVLVCDTSPLTTLGYAELDSSPAASALRPWALRPYALNVLCEPDFGLVQDGTRRDLSWQQGQHAWTLQALAQRGMPYLHVRGPVAGRVAAVLAALEPSERPGPSA
ncbi:AAA family ATPase [Ideonella paludis]|uniref:AAA family ATPase n=1 Tax=Ideonella paludis TaxID=1233411 RepID=A0ABS5E0R8_9BURK|nr:AAA family ATPase [Ideonella paludis]MBQ0936988.1 AAA family ATPase [Ideonella paludis]